MILSKITSYFFLISKLYFSLFIIFIIDLISLSAFAACPGPMGSCTPSCNSSCTYYTCDPVVQNQPMIRLPIILSSINDGGCGVRTFEAQRMPFFLPRSGRRVDRLPDSLGFDDAYMQCVPHTTNGPPCCTQTGTGLGGNNGYWWTGQCVSTNVATCSSAGTMGVGCYLTNPGTQCTRDAQGNIVSCPAACCNTAQPSNQCTITTSGNWERSPTFCTQSVLSACGGDSSGDQHFTPNCRFQCCLSGTFPTSFVDVVGCTVPKHQQENFDFDPNSFGRRTYDTYSYGDWWAWPWGQCTPRTPGACGTRQGTRTRTVQCQPRGCNCGNSEQCCDPAQKPAEVEDCDIFLNWSTIFDGSFSDSDCSPCGTPGTKTRSAVCLNPNRSVADSGCCNPTTKPADQFNACTECCDPVTQFSGRAYSITAPNRAPGSSATLTCPSPNSGTSIVSCQFSNMSYSWQGPEPICTCGDPILQFPSFTGTITFTNQTAVGSQATLTCQPPLVGGPTIETCIRNADGSASWQGNDPTCSCNQMSAAPPCLWSFQGGPQFQFSCDTPISWPSTAVGASATETTTCANQTIFSFWTCSAGADPTPFQRSCTSAGWGPVTGTPCQCPN